MQFIERLFDLSPDAGSGLLEFSLIAILLTVAALPVLLSRATKREDTHRRRLQVAPEHSLRRFSSASRMFSYWP